MEEARKLLAVAADVGLHDFDLARGSQMKKQLLVHFQLCR
jgi:hypothetical protein